MGEEPTRQPNPAERRAQPRYPVHLRVELQSPEQQFESSHEGQTHNISSSGFYLVGAPDSLREGSRVQVSLWLPEGLAGEQARLRGLGRVVRLDQRQDEGLGIGVQFERVELAPKGKQEETES